MSGQTAPVESASPRNGEGDIPRRPDLFIVGAPKAGTTSLYEYLKGHPQVYMSPVKEPFYFAPDVVVGPRTRFRHDRDEDGYLALFAEARDETRLGEASTNYLASRVAPSLIRQFQPAARIVAMLRNPVEMIHALHNERVSHGVEPITDFAAALAADADRIEGRRLPDGTTSLGAVYVDTGRYGEQLARWIEEFGRDRVHVMIFDDFVADTAGSFRRLLEFLEVDPEYRPDSFAVHNPSHRLRGGPIRAVVESRIARWGVRRLLPRLVGHSTTVRLTRSFRHSRLNRRQVARSSVPSRLRRQLEEELAADIVRLSDLLSRDLSALWFGRPARRRTIQRKSNHRRAHGRSIGAP